LRLADNRLPDGYSDGKEAMDIFWSPLGELEERTSQVLLQLFFGFRVNASFSQTFSNLKHMMLFPLERR
jgi:hypothetical protein